MSKPKPTIVTSNNVTWGDLTTSAAGIYTVSAGTLYDQEWDEKRWIEYFERNYSKNPEAMKAMATINSKLYKAVK